MSAKSGGIQEDITEVNGLLSNLLKHPIKGGSTPRRKEPSDVGKILSHSPVVSIPQEGRELVLKIYDSVRQEIQEFIKELGQLVVTAIIASGAVWSWALVSLQQLNNIGKPSAIVVLLVPTVLAAFFFLRAIAIRQLINVASDHLAKIEAAFMLDENFGWDSFWRARRINKQSSRWVGLLDGWLFIYWFFICFANIIASIISIYSLLTM
jgi:hypothetical protein